MKKVILGLFAIVLALTMAFSVGTVAFACGPNGEADADVTIDGPTVPTTPVTGTQITVSGKIKVEANAEAAGFFVFAGAESNAGYSVSNPTGGILSSGANSESDSDFGLFQANSDADQTYTWQYKFTPLVPGDYIIYQYGDANAWFWAIIGGSGDAEDNAIRTFVFRVFAQSNLFAPKRCSMLHITTPNGVMSQAFYPSDGYNTGIVSQDISFTSGGVTIKILKGTTILMDGQPQLQVWLIFNADGTIIGRWGANQGIGVGQMLATTVSFSQLPVITK